MDPAGLPRSSNSVMLFSHEYKHWWHKDSNCSHSADNCHCIYCVSSLTTQLPTCGEMGVPQGSILSVTLFALKINLIVKSVSPGVECSLYVDDFLICYRSKFVHIIERHLQQTLNKLQHWVDTNGFKFSETKTVLSITISGREMNK